MGTLLIIGTCFGIVIFIIWSLIVGLVTGAAFCIAVKRCIKEDMEKEKEEDNSNN